MNSSFFKATAPNVLVDESFAKVLSLHTILSELAGVPTTSKLFTLFAGEASASTVSRVHFFDLLSSRSECFSRLLLDHVFREITQNVEC